MKYNKTFREALKQVREEPDHEISMARGELKATADKALELVAALEGKSDEGNPMEAWVQSKITKASDYMSAIYHYLEYEFARKSSSLMEHLDNHKKQAKRNILMEGVMDKFFEAAGA